MLVNNILNDQLLNQIPVPGKTGVDWYFFCWFLNRYKNTNMLEIGAGDGGSTLSMAAFAKHLTVIDSWDQNWPKEKVEVLTKKYNASVTYIDKKSCEVKSTDLSNFSIVHLDANKDYQCIIDDLELVSNISKIICVDDYLQSMWPEVTWAVDNWLTVSNWRRIFISNHQVFLAKKDIPIKEIVVNWSVIDRGHGYHLTYGPFDNSPLVQRFIDAGNMTYTWHANQQ